VLILGQGLSGTCLGLNLAMHEKKFQILSGSDGACASEKAAGLMNPVTGRRMALTWNYEKVWPLAFQFYPQALSFLKRNPDIFFSSRNIRKALHSVEEMNFLEAKSAWAGFQEIVRIEKKKSQDPEVFENLCGWAISENGARLEVPAFLDEARQYFIENRQFLNQNFNRENLQKTPKGWQFNGIQYDAVVSCLGLGCPWISPELWAVKGQLYRLEGLPDWGADILKTEHFLIPLQNGSVLAGSTYEREFEHEEPDQAGYEGITAELLPEHKSKTKIIQAWCGIRPTTKDRRPVIRQLDEGLFAVNGLGSKGVSLAPYAADQLMKMLYPAE
jgi:glycine/D-amino acid oxidase-like deaminating enzyme